MTIDITVWDANTAAIAAEIPQTAIADGVTYAAIAGDLTDAAAVGGEGLFATPSQVIRIRVALFVAAGKQPPAPKSGLMTYMGTRYRVANRVTTTDGLEYVFALESETAQ